MLKNYFLLNRFSLEANKELKGFIIDSIFTQDKNRIVICLVKNSIEIFIEISVDHGSPYIVQKPQFSRAKKNSIDVFPEYFPQDVYSFQIAESDRVIKINCENVSIYFAIRGKYTNVFLAEDHNIFSFKNASDESSLEFLKEVNSINFITDFNSPEFIVDNKDDLRKKYPFIGKEIILEAELRGGSDISIKEFLIIIESIIHEIKSKDLSVFIDGQSSEINIAPETFHIFPFDKKESFSRYSDCVNFYLRKKYFLESTQSLETKINKFLNRELEKLSSKINNLKSRLDKQSRADEYEKIGNILLINLNSLRAGMKEIELENIYEENKNIKIKLQENLSPKRNADFYFDKAKNERISLEKSKELFESAKKKYERYLQLKLEVDSFSDPAQLKNIMKELNLKDEQNISPKDELRDKFKHYIIEEKYHVFVGKDSKNNDLLTIKFAKQNDFWFHARSVPGSHVVLRVENTKEAVPKNILKKTAAIAAYHSKAKTSGMAPVSYSQKKYVVKKKGMEPGKVALLKEEVLIVRPEIPSGCEFITGE